MIRYSTSTSVGIADKFTEPVNAVTYTKNKHSKTNTTSSEIDFINVLKVEVHSQVDSSQMSQLVASLHPDVMELLEDSDKMGLAISLGKDTIKSLVYKDDNFEDVHNSIMKDYLSLMETQNTTDTARKKEDIHTM